MCFITTTTSTMSITIIPYNNLFQLMKLTIWLDLKVRLKDHSKKIIVLLWRVVKASCLFINTSNSITTTIITYLWESGPNNSLWDQRMKYKQTVMYNLLLHNLLVLIRLVMPCSAEVSLAVPYVITSLLRIIINLTGPLTIKYLDHQNRGMLLLVDRVKVSWYKISLLCTITDLKMFLNGNQLYNRYLTHKKTLTCWLNSKLIKRIPTRIT